MTWIAGAPGGLEDSRSGPAWTRDRSGSFATQFSACYAVLVHCIGFPLSMSSGTVWLSGYSLVSVTYLVIALHPCIVVSCSVYHRVLVVSCPDYRVV